MARRQQGIGKGKKSGGRKKYGRNLAKCARYRERGTRARNKARRDARRKRGFQK